MQSKVVEVLAWGYDRGFSVRYFSLQEGNEQALYFDADILDVQRRRHDVRGCRCRFWVRYRHDQTEVPKHFDLMSCDYSCQSNLFLLLTSVGTC